MPESLSLGPGESFSLHINLSDHFRLQEAGNTLLQSPTVMNGPLQRPARDSSLKQPGPRTAKSLIWPEEWHCFSPGMD
jgi:hypothetical protein